MSESARENEDKYHVIDAYYSIKYDIEKSAILSNIDRFHNVPYDKLYIVFPYINKKKFYQHIQELIELGELLLNDTESIIFKKK